MELLEVLGIFVVLFCFGIGGHVVHSWNKKRGGKLDQGHHYLLVIAHPDDECMFFAPTILVKFIYF